MSLCLKSSWFSFNFEFFHSVAIHVYSRKLFSRSKLVSWFLMHAALKWRPWSAFESGKLKWECGHQYDGREKNNNPILGKLQVSTEAATKQTPLIRGPPKSPFLVFYSFLFSSLFTWVHRLSPFSSLLSILTLNKPQTNPFLTNLLFEP